MGSVNNLVDGIANSRVEMCSQTLGDTDAPLGVAGKPAAAVCLRVAVGELTTALLYIQDQLQVQRHDSCAENRGSTHGSSLLDRVDIRAGQGRGCAEEGDGDGGQGETHLGGVLVVLFVDG